jgi:hypothetical protein
VVMVEAVKRLYAEVGGTKRRLLFAGAPVRAKDGAPLEAHDQVVSVEQQP